MLGPMTLENEDLRKGWGCSSVGTPNGEQLEVCTGCEGFALSEVKKMLGVPASLKDTNKVTNLTEGQEQN